MRILALDTTADRLGVCLWEDGKSKEVDKKTPSKHDAALEQAVDKVLAGSNALDAIVVATGPGRFTGIRVATTFGVMAGRAWGVPVLGLQVLETLAWQALRASGADVVAVVRPAIREELFFGLYRRGPQAAAPDRWGEPKDLAPLLEGVHGVVLAGEGAKDFKKKVGLAAPVVVEGLKPRVLAERAAELLRSGAELPPPVPYYLKPGSFEKAK